MSTALSYFFLMCSCNWSVFHRFFRDAWATCENVFRTELRQKNTAALELFTFRTFRKITLKTHSLDFLVQFAAWFDLNPYSWQVL